MINDLSFEILNCHSCLIGRPFFNREDYSFNYLMDADQEEHYGKKGTTSFAIDTLQLEFSIENMMCLYISGYCPVEMWKADCLSAPIARRGALHAKYTGILNPAIVICIDDMVPPDPWFDPHSGWFCMGRKEAQAGAAAVEFATGCLGVVIDKKLSSLWIKPENWRELAGHFLNKNHVN
jgi:hypothetical protein